MLGRNQYRSGQKQSAGDGNGKGYNNKYNTPMNAREKSLAPADDDDIVYVGTTTTFSKNKYDQDPDDVVYVGTTATLPSDSSIKDHDDIIYVGTVASQKRKAYDDLPSTSAACKKSKYDVTSSYRNDTTRYHSESQQRGCNELKPSSNHKKRKKPDDYDVEAAIKTSIPPTASPSEDLNSKRFKSTFTVLNDTKETLDGSIMKELRNPTQKLTNFSNNSDGSTMKELRNHTEKMTNFSNNSENSSISRGRFQKESDGYEHLASFRFDMPESNLSKGSAATTTITNLQSEKSSKVRRKSRFSDLIAETNQITGKKLENVTTVENEVGTHGLVANIKESSKRVADYGSIAGNFGKQYTMINSKQRLPRSEEGLAKCHKVNSSFNSKTETVLRACLKTSTSGSTLPLRKDKFAFSERENCQNLMRCSKSCNTNLNKGADKVIENTTSDSVLPCNSSRLKSETESINLNKSKFSNSSISSKKDLQSKYPYESKPDFIGFKKNSINSLVVAAASNNNSSNCLENNKNAECKGNHNSNFNSALSQNEKQFRVQNDGGGKTHADVESFTRKTLLNQTELNASQLSDTSNFKSSSNLENICNQAIKPVMVENRSQVLQKPAYSNFKQSADANISSSYIGTQLENYTSSLQKEFIKDSENSANVAKRLQNTSDSLSTSMSVDKPGFSLNNQQKTNKNSEYNCGQVLKVGAPINQPQFKNTYDHRIHKPDSNCEFTTASLKLGTNFANSSYGMDTSSFSLATNSEKPSNTVPFNGCLKFTHSTRFSENSDFTKNNLCVGKPSYENLKNIKNNFNSTAPGNTKNFNSSYSNKNFTFSPNILPYPQNLSAPPPLPTCKINSYDRNMGNHHSTQYSNISSSLGSNSENSFGLQHSQSNSYVNNRGPQNVTIDKFPQNHGHNQQQLEISRYTGVARFNEEHGNTNKLLPFQMPSSAGKKNTFEFNEVPHSNFMHYPPPNQVQFENAHASGNSSQFGCNNNFENSNNTLQMGNPKLNRFGSHLNEDPKNIQFGMKRRWSNNKTNIQHNKEIEGIFDNKNCLPPAKPSQLGQNPNFYFINPAPPVPDLTKPPPPLPHSVKPTAVINTNLQNRPLNVTPRFGNVNPNSNYGPNTNFTYRNGTNFQNRSQNNGQRFGNNNLEFNNGPRQTRGFARNNKGAFKTTRQPLKENTNFPKPCRPFAQNNSAEKIQNTFKLSNQNKKASSSKSNTKRIFKVAANRASNKSRPNTFGTGKNMRCGKQPNKFSKLLKSVKTKNAIKKPLDPVKKERKTMLRKIKKSKQKSGDNTKSPEDHIDVNKHLFGDFVPIKVGLKKPAKGHLKPNPEIYWKEWWSLYGYVEKFLKPIDANDPDVKSALYFQYDIDTLEYRKRKRVILVMGAAKILRHIKLNERDYALRDIYSVLKYKHQLEDPLFQENLNDKDKDRVEKVLKQARKKTRRAFFYQNMICRWHFSSLLLKRADAGESLIKCGHARKLMKDKAFQYLVWESIQELKKLIAEDWPEFEQFYKSF